MTLKTFSQVMTIALVLTYAPSAHSAQISDLATDWSDVNNPNGPWSYNDGVGTISPSVSWLATQPAWARAAFPNGGHIVAWLKATSASATCAFPISPNCDFLAGDVLTHTWDSASGSGSAAPSHVTWTAPFDAQVNVSGNVWLARNIQRAANWTLLLNDVVQDGGLLADGDAFSRASPDSFSLPGISVQAGDRITLRFDSPQSISQFGEFVGVNLTIDAAEASLAPVPEPTTFLLWGTTVVGVGLVRRLKRGRPH